MNIPRAGFAAAQFMVCGVLTAAPGHRALLAGSERA
jgi:hypothetical protein